MKKAAVVTGASSGIGLAISRMLVKNGYEVFGIARDFSKVHKEEQFNMIECDITDTEKITQILKKIMSENELYILINNAGVGYYGLSRNVSIRPFNSCSWNAEKTDSGNWNGKCCTKWPSLKMWLFRPVEEHLVFLITWSI